jgi:hypothetical protein
MGSFIKLLDQTINNKYITLNQLYDAIHTLQETEPEHVASVDSSNQPVPVDDTSNNTPTDVDSRDPSSNADFEHQYTSKNIDLSLLTLLLSDPSSTSVPNGPHVPHLPPTPPAHPAPQPEHEDNANLSLLALLDIPHESDELSESEDN